MVIWGGILNLMGFYLVFYESFRLINTLPLGEDMNCVRSRFLIFGVASTCMFLATIHAIFGDASLSFKLFLAFPTVAYNLMCLYFRHKNKPLLQT